MPTITKCPECGWLLVRTDRAPTARSYHCATRARAPHRSWLGLHRRREAVGLLRSAQEAEASAADALRAAAATWPAVPIPPWFGSGPARPAIQRQRSNHPPTRVHTRSGAAVLPLLSRSRGLSVPPACRKGPALLQVLAQSMVNSVTTRPRCFYAMQSPLISYERALCVLYVHDDVCSLASPCFGAAAVASAVGWSGTRRTSQPPRRSWAMATASGGSDEPIVARSKACLAIAVGPVAYAVPRRAPRALSRSGTPLTRAPPHAWRTGSFSGSCTGPCSPAPVAPLGEPPRALAAPRREACAGPASSPAAFAARTPVPPGSERTSALSAGPGPSARWSH